LRDDLASEPRRFAYWANAGEHEVACRWNGDFEFWSDPVTVSLAWDQTVVVQPYLRRGDYTIGGRVLDTEGRPVGDVSVLAQVSGGGGEDSRAEFMRQLGGRRKYLKYCRSDAAGAWSCRGLPAGTLRVTATTEAVTARYLADESESALNGKGVQ